MATMKNVQIQAKLGDRFKMSSTIREHTVYVDQPRAGGGDDAGPTPLEYLELALAGCIGAIGRIVANQKKIALRGMDIKVEGELDVDTLLGKGQESRAGFSGFKATVAVDADMTNEEKRAFLAEIERRCPVSDNLTAATPVSISLE